MHRGGWEQIVVKIQFKEKNNKSYGSGSIRKYRDQSK